jgi:hypothetical protein
VALGITNQRGSEPAGGDRRHLKLPPECTAESLGLKHATKVIALRRALESAVAAAPRWYRETRGGDNRLGAKSQKRRNNCGAPISAKSSAPDGICWESEGYDTRLPKSRTSVRWRKWGGGFDSHRQLQIPFFLIFQ